MNQLVPAALGPELGSSTVSAAVPGGASRTQARLSTDVTSLCGGAGARRLFAVDVVNVGREAWNEEAPTQRLRCRLFSFGGDFLQELPPRRLPRVAPGERARVAMDLVLPLAPGRFALALGVAGEEPDEPGAPLFVSVESLPAREPAWNARGLVDAAFRAFSGAPAEERALDWWARRLADGIPIESFFASFEDVAGGRYPEQRSLLVERLASFAPSAQNAQAILD